MEDSQQAWRDIVISVRFRVPARSDNDDLEVLADRILELVPAEGVQIDVDIMGE